MQSKRFQLDAEGENVRASKRGAGGLLGGLAACAGALALAAPPALAALPANDFFATSLKRESRRRRRGRGEMEQRECGRDSAALRPALAGV